MYNGYEFHYLITLISITIYLLQSSEESSIVTFEIAKAFGLVSGVKYKSRS